MLNTEILRILSPLSAPWCGWTMLALLLFAILSEMLQPGIIRQAPESLLSQNDRTYKESPDTFFGQLFITLFRIGTLGMALCLCVCPDGSFRFAVYAAICGLILAVILLKMLCNILIDSVFQLSRRFGKAYEHYANIATLAALTLYPLLLLHLHFSSVFSAQWILGIVAALFVLLWLYRSARQFVRSPLAILYLLVYITTLECLPFAALYLLSDKTISIL